jgi:NAD(P)-dependent dehydrogenase (short-subunit alcohol dehydrogenase family)
MNVTSSATSKAVLITGASGGIGEATARRLAGLGHQVLLGARRTERLGSLAEELRAAGGLVAHRELDVTSLDSMRAFAAAGLQEFGRIDVLINNASELGPSPMPTLEEFPIASLGTLLQVNLVGPLKLSQLVLPGMRARGTGLIVNVTSDAGVQAYPTWGGYGASKAALEHLSRVLSAELEGSGIRVYIVDPGDMDTAMHRAAEPGVDLSHLPSPAKVAPAFVQLLDETTPSGRFEAQRLVTVAT